LPAEPVVVPAVEPEVVPEVTTAPRVGGRGRERPEVAVEAPHEDTPQVEAPREEPVVVQAPVETPEETPVTNGRLRVGTGAGNLRVRP